MEYVPILFTVVRRVKPDRVELLIHPGATKLQLAEHGRRKVLTISPRIHATPRKTIPAPKRVSLLKTALKLAKAG